MKLIDLYQGQGQRWYFTWQPSTYDDFVEEKAHMKAELHRHDLRWHADEKCWSVENADDIQHALALVFANAAWYFDMLRRQQDLFTRG